MPWQGDMKRTWREENAAFAAMSCVSGKEQLWQKQGGFDYFTTTLSISPLKNAQKLNEIGIRLGEEYGVPYLQSDFKKKNGYKRSTELSAQYGLYRQNYCGCVFSQEKAKSKLGKLKLDIDRQM